MTPDLTSQSFMANPFAACDRLRGEGPLVRVKLPIIGRVWIATTQAALAAVLKDTENFSMRRANGKVAGMQWWMPRSVGLLANNMLTFDDPDHKRLRQLVDRAFRRDAITALEPRIEARAAELARSLFDNRDEADLVTAYARQLPLAVICDLLGVSDTVKERFAAQAGRLTSVNSVLGFVRAFASLGRFTRLVEAEIERVRRSAGTGLIAELVAMQQAGEPISDDEMIAMVFLLLVAGHETTTHVISGGIYELLRDPARRQWLMADESRMALAVEEILRFISAVQFSKPRIARRDLEVEGTRVARGEMVMAMIAAANSDPAAIECPHRFDMERRANRHVAFGAGPHFCLGHQLARIEIACAIRALFATWPQLRLAVAQDDIRWRSRVGLRAIERLPATIIR